MRKRFRSTISFLLAVITILSNVGFIHAEAAGGTDITDGLLAHYDFEDVSGTSVPNTADSTSYAGTLSGSAAIVDIEGIAQPSKALRLGSAAGGMQLTNIVNASTSSFSVSMWYQASTTSSSNVNLVQAGTIGGSTGRTILILDPNSKYQTYVTGDNAKTPTTNAVTPTAWQHITFVYDLANSKAYFYVNGVADRADGLSLSGTALNTGDMIIGRHRNANEGQFNGLIDEVRVYNKVLSATEAAAIYENTKAAYRVPPVGDITLTVNASETVRVIDSDSIFGINHRYAFNGYGSFDSENMKIKDDFLTLYEDAGFGSIRYPGGTISNLFNWKTSIGPVEQRKNQIHGFYNNPGQGGIAPNFGLTEIGTFAESVDSEIVYVYSLGRGNAQDAADLIEYLNAKVGTNPNGGIDWAAVRAENGHPEPYNVRYFEIGNEMQQAWAGSDGTASQGYWITSVAAGSEAAYIDGGTAAFTKQYAVCEEDWNATASLTDGSANMVRYMRYANVNPKMEDGNGNIVDDPSFKAINDDVSVYVGSTQWTIVDSFANSGPSDQHVVIDYSTGGIHFGDGTHGAIPSASQQIYVSYSVERQGFIAVSRAMKETTDAINRAEGTNHVVNVYSSYESQGFINKMSERNANDLYDGLTIHPYSGDPGGTGTSFYDSAMSKAEAVGIRNVQNYVNMMPADKVPVISEYGIFRSTNPLVRSQTHAIYIAKVLMEYVRLGSPYIQKHCLVDWYSAGADSLGPTQQAVIQAVPGSDADTKTGEGSFTFFSTPSAHVFKMLNNAFADNIISTEFSTVPTMSNGAKTLSALASKDSSGTVYLAIVNASREEDYQLTLYLKNMDLTGAAVTASVLTADSFDAQNSPDNPNNVTVETQDVAFDPDHFTYTIPKHSFVILTIAPCDAHTYSANGFCTSCDACQPARLNADNVYEISNAGQLYWFADLVNAGNAHANAILTADIVVNRNVLVDDALNTDAATVASFRVWNAIGYQDTTSQYVYYTGTFDGRGHTVSGLYYQGTMNYMGLFGCTDTGAVIQNVGVIDSWISAGENAGYASVGGIVGRAGGTAVTGCWNDSVIIGSGNAVGGIVGEAEKCVITDCFNHGAVSGNSLVGGIAGTSSGSVTDCYNTGTVTGAESGSNIGGIVGNANHYSDDSASDDYFVYITRCYNIGNVQNGDNIGGILGSGNFCILNDCYNTGSVTGKSVYSYAAGAGGIIGDANRSCTVDDCYNTGVVAANYKSVGGIMGSKTQSTVTNCYYLTGCASDGDAAVQNGVGATNSGATTADTAATVAATAEEFASGEITWLLNHETDQGELVWFQTIGTDASPKFEGKVVHHQAGVYYNDEMPAESESVIRLSGKGRCETALLIAEELKETLEVEKFNTIIIANGNNFADALAGSYLAAVKDAPILLSWGSNDKHAANIQYIKDNLVSGGTVYILGGTAAVPGLYEEDLADIHVERLSGKSRFDTNIEILEEAGIDANSEILVSTGWNYADSLSASATGKPILLLDTNTGKLEESQTAFLSELEEKNCTFTIIGGTGAVGAQLETALEAYGNVDRISGKTRYETSVKVAEAYFEDPESAVLAYGRNFPDGLCGGALAFSMNAPLILTQTGAEAAAADYVQGQGIKSGVVLGGTGALSDEVVRAVFAMEAEDEIIVKK